MSSSEAPVAENSPEIGLENLQTSGDDPRENVREPRNATEAVAPLEATPAVILKVISAAFCFFNAGVNDGSLGALIPYILRSYNISTAKMAIPYGVGFFGWLLAAIFGGYLRVALGTGGYIMAGAGLQLLAQILRFWLPPFGLFSFSFFIVALGQAFQDSQANTFVATIKKAHRWLGLIHGCYAIGLLVGPIIAAAMASNLNGQWALFYYVPTGIGAVNIMLCIYAFRDETTIYERITHGRPERSLDTHRATAARVELMATLKQRAVWLLSFFYFLYVGTAITAGGWVVEYLHVVRDGPLSQVGYISAAFAGGTALGRFVLVEPTFRLGEKRMLLLYITLSLVLQIIFWRVPNIAVDSVMISFIGFLLGPAFATGVSVASKLIPTELRPSSLSLIFVLAQAGGAIFPAVTGVISAEAGVATLQPMLVGLLAAMVVAWFIVPDPRKKAIQ